jgi:hypothetical protein
MVNYSQTERTIKRLFENSGGFTFNKKNYKLIIVDKPKTPKGEPKTDIYIRGQANDSSEIEIKISVKQSNHDFLEN